MSNARLAAFVVVFHILAADAFAQIGQGRLIGSVTDAPHLRFIPLGNSSRMVNAAAFLVNCRPVVLLLFQRTISMWRPCVETGSTVIRQPSLRFYIQLSMTI